MNPVDAVPALMRIVDRHDQRGQGLRLLPAAPTARASSMRNSPAVDTSSISHMNITGNLSSRGLRSFSPSISAMNANFTDSPSQTTPLLFLGSPAPSSAGGSRPRAPAAAPARRYRAAFPSSFPDFFAVFTQFASVPSLIPRFRAISAIGRPELITRSTASSLYSWVYFLRACPTSGSLLVDHRATSDGVYETGGRPRPISTGPSKATTRPALARSPPMTGIVNRLSPGCHH